MASGNQDAKKLKKPCAIVSMGCLLPGASNPLEFWQLLLAGETQIKPLSNERWKKQYNYNPYPDAEDKSYSYYGAEIPHENFLKLQKKHELANFNRLNIMTLEALDQAKIELPYERERIGFFLGIMNPDENYFATRFHTHIDDLNDKLKLKYTAEEFLEVEPFFKKHCKEVFKEPLETLDDILPSSVLPLISDRFNIKGPSFLLDAACASGLASLDTALLYLQSGELDFVYAGASESNLGQGTYVLFSKVGALAKNITLPFDQASEGLSQGEGCVIFGLERLEDAIKNNHTILAVLDTVGSSSDGRVASLFQPDTGGQELALNRAYHLQANKQIDFLEMHGTGTKTGDQTEVLSCSSVFSDFEVPTGSVKALIGHTKGAAGAASVLKAVLMFQHQILPNSKYYKEGLLEKERPRQNGLFINTKNVEKKTWTNAIDKIGVSSFGFGGTNFHVLLKRFKPGEYQSSNCITESVYLLGSVEIPFTEFKTSWFTDAESFYKLPPKSVEAIDKAQLLAVKACFELCKTLNLQLEYARCDDIAVISGSTLGLDILNVLVDRISIDTLIESLKEKGRDRFQLSKHLYAIKNTYPRITEEFGPGILNNVIAGRVCNAFHFRGKNLNVDADLISGRRALELASLAIRAQQFPAVFVISVNERVNSETLKVERQSVSAFLLGNLEFAQKNFLSIKSELKLSQVQNKAQNGACN